MTGPHSGSGARSAASCSGIRGGRHARPRGRTAGLLVLAALVLVSAVGCGSSRTGRGPGGAAASRKWRGFTATGLGISLQLPATWITQSAGGSAWMIGQPLRGGNGEVDDSKSYMSLEPVPGTMPQAIAAFGQGVPQKDLTIHGRPYVRVDIPHTPTYDIVGQGTSVFILAVSPRGKTDAATLNAIIASLQTTA